MDSPLAAVTDGLSSGKEMLYTETNGTGHFVFDGIAGGPYELGLFTGELEQGYRAGGALPGFQSGASAVV